MSATVKNSWFMTAMVYGSLGLFFAVGVLLLFLGIRNFWRASSSTSWPVAPAVVIQSVQETSRSSDGSSTVNAKIVAKYQVGGREYTTDTIHFGQTVGSSDSSDAELLNLRYPEAKAIKVSHHPTTPEVATIEPGFDADALWLPGAGLAFILVAVMFTSLYRSSEGSGGMAFGVTLFAAIFMMIGTPMLVVGGLNLYRAYVSQKWPTVKGEIVYDEVDEEVVTKREKGRTRTSATYGARIVFQYEVAGTRHYSNTRRFGALAGSSDENWANEIADRYPAGAKFDVHYNPSNPNLAILEPGIDSEAFWIPGAGLAFFAFGVAAALIIVPSLKKFP